MASYYLRVALVLVLHAAVALAFNVNVHATNLGGMRKGGMVARSDVPAVLMMAKKAKKGGGAAKGGTVQVVLNAPVKGVGKKGDVVSVKSAYAENVIIRGGLGALATQEILEQIAEQDAANAEAAAAAKAAAVANAAALTKLFGEKGCVITKNVGPDGAIFGSITPTEIADVLSKEAGITVQKKDIKTPVSHPGLNCHDLSRSRPAILPLLVRCLLRHRSPSGHRVDPRLRRTSSTSVLAPRRSRCTRRSSTSSKWSSSRRRRDHGRGMTSQQRSRRHVSRSLVPAICSIGRL